MYKRQADGNEPSPEVFEAMLQRILEAGQRAGVPVGLHTPTPEVANKRIAEGWQLVAIGSDAKMLVEKATQWVEAVGLDGASDLARY